MTKAILAILITFSFTANAQGILKKQSTLSIFPGIFNLVFSSDVPIPDYVTDFESAEDQENMTIAAHNKELRYYNPESNFVFLNDKESFKGLFDKDLGVCRGYSSLRRKFRLIGFFDHENKAGANVPDKKETKKYRKFYKKLVKNLRKNKPTVIPGYANLKEFSSDPVVSNMLKWQVFHEWRKKNYSRHTGTGNLLGGAFNKSTYEELLAMRDKVESYSQNGLNTMIWLTVKKSTWIHVLEAVEVTPVQSNGEFVFKLWNDKSNSEELAYSYLTVKANGDLLYDDHIDPTRTINAAGITRENDGEIHYLANQLKGFLKDR